MKLDSKGGYELFFDISGLEFDMSNWRIDLFQICLAPILEIIPGIHNHGTIKILVLIVTGDPLSTPVLTKFWQHGLVTTPPGLRDIHICNQCEIFLSWYLYKIQHRIHVTRGIYRLRLQPQKKI